MLSINGSLLINRSLLKKINQMHWSLVVSKDFPHLKQWATKKKIAGFVYNWLRHIDFVGFWIFRHLKKISNCFHRCKWCSYSSDDTFLPYIIKWKAQASGFKATYGLKINTTSNSFYIELLPFHQCLQLPCLLSQPLTTHPRLPNQLTFTATT